MQRGPKDRVIVPLRNSDKAVRKREEAFKSLHKNPTQANGTDYKRGRALARKTVWMQRRNVGRNFVGHLAWIL